MSSGIVIGGFVIGFIKGWLFTLCVIGISPIMFVGVYFFTKNIMKSF